MKKPNISKAYFLSIHFTSSKLDIQSINNILGLPEFKENHLCGPPLCQGGNSVMFHASLKIILRAEKSLRRYLD
jgi:hypothetical protein